MRGARTEKRPEPDHLSTKPSQANRLLWRRRRLFRLARRSGYVEAHLRRPVGAGGRGEGLGEFPLHFQHLGRSISVAAILTLLKPLTSESA